HIDRGQPRRCPFELSGLGRQLRRRPVELGGLALDPVGVTAAITTPCHSYSVPLTFVVLCTTLWYHVRQPVRNPPLTPRRPSSRGASARAAWASDSATCGHCVGSISTSLPGRCSACL